MPIYFGKALKSANAKQLSDLVPGADMVRVEPDKARVFAAFTRLSITRQDVVAHPNHVYAAAYEQHVIALGTPLPTYVEAGDRVNIRLPPLCVHYNKFGKEALDMINPLGFERQKIFNKELLIFKNPTLEAVKTIIKTNPNRDCQCPVNTCNLSSFLVGVKMLQFTSMTLEALGSVAKIDRDATAGIVVPITRKRPLESKLGPNKRIIVGEVDDYRYNHLTPEDKEGKKYIRGAKYEFNFGQFNLNADSHVDAGVLPTDLQTFLPDSYNSMEGSGLFFPFIDKLAEPDYSVVPRFIWKYWRFHLGDNEEEQSSIYNNMSAAWGVLTRTYFGHQLAHLLKCCELCIDANASLGIKVINGLYTGSVIFGEHFFVNVEGKVYKPIMQSELAKELAEADTHASALDAIFKIVDELEKDTSMEDESGTNATLISSFKEMKGKFTTIRELSIYLQQLPLSAIQKEQVVEIAGKLNFGETYFAYSANYIEKVMNFIINDTEAIPTSTPLYYRYIFSVDRIEQAFGAFGAEAPTFNVPGGAAIHLGSNAAIPNKTNFVTRPVDNLRAVLDFKDIVQTKRFYNFPGASSKKAKDKSYDKKDRERIWATFTRAIGVAPVDSILAIQPSTSSVLDSRDFFDL